jgi:drug/metabolite transporter (DMT)-like permease
LDSTGTGTANAALAKSGNVRGYFFIAGATLFWAISASLGRAVFTGRLGSGAAIRPIDPLILAQSRTTISLIVLFPVLLMLRRGSRGFAMPRRDIALCLMLGVLGMAASNYFYYLAIQKTSVATAIILQYTAPVWVLLYMIMRRFQKATAQRIVSVVLAVLGSALAIGILSSGRIRINNVGVIAAQLAAVSFAFYNVVAGSILQRHDRWRVLTWVLVGAAVFWQFINPAWKIARASYSTDQWLFMFVFAITSILIPFSLYFRGLQFLDATRAIVTSCLEPVFSIAIAAAFLGELLGPLQVVGIILVLISTVVVQLPDRRQHDAAAVLVEPIE